MSGRGKSSRAAARKVKNFKKLSEVGFASEADSMSGSSEGEEARLQVVENADKDKSDEVAESGESQAVVHVDDENIDECIAEEEAQIAELKLALDKKKKKDQLAELRTLKAALAAQMKEAPLPPSAASGSKEAKEKGQKQSRKLLAAGSKRVQKAEESASKALLVASTGDERALRQLLELDEPEGRKPRQRGRKKQPATFTEDSSEDSESGSSLAFSGTQSDSSIEFHARKHKRLRRKSSRDKIRKLKSGLKIKSGGRYVKNPQIWPQAALQGELAAQRLTFEELDMEKFMAGELEIATSDDIGRIEKTGRLLLLKELCYLATVHEWDFVRSIYAAIMYKVEMGLLAWNSNLYPSIQWMLARSNTSRVEKQVKQVNVVKQTNRFNRGKFQQNNPFGVVWCLKYQSQACDEDSGHPIKFRGMDGIPALHICATCWQRDKKQSWHPSNSNVCPRNVKIGASSSQA